MSSHPTSKARRKRQKLKRVYARLREDCQLAGVIETVPEGAVRDERVSPSVQTEQPLPELVARAIRNGWATEESKKPELVDELVAIVLNPDMPAGKKITAFKALLDGDQRQYERDHPEAGKDRKAGGAVVLNVNIVPVEERAGAPAVEDFRAMTDGRILPAPEMGLSGAALSGTHTDGPLADKPTTRPNGFFF